MRVVYFLRREDGTGPIKIGCSTAPEWRATDMGYALKAKVVVLAAAPGDFFAEGNVHRKFAHLNEPQKWAVHRPYPFGGANEWFSAAPELLAFVAEVARIGSLPLAPEEQRERIFATRYLAGETLQAIASDYGLSRERVRQVLRDIGVPSRGHRRWANQYRQAAA